MMVRAQPPLGVLMVIAHASNVPAIALDSAATLEMRRPGRPHVASNGRPLREFAGCFNYHSDVAPYAWVGLHHPGPQEGAPTRPQPIISRAKRPADCVTDMVCNGRLADCRSPGSRDARVTHSLAVVYAPQNWLTPIVWPPCLRTEPAKGDPETV